MLAKPPSLIRATKGVGSNQESQSRRLELCLNWLFSAPSKDALQRCGLPPEIISLYFNTHTADGIAGFKMPMLSSRIRWDAQITLPLKVFSYQNMKDGSFNET